MVKRGASRMGIFDRGVRPTTNGWRQQRQAAHHPTSTVKMDSKDVAQDDRDTGFRLR